MEIRRSTLLLLLLLPALTLGSCIYIPEKPEPPVIEEPFVMTLDCALQTSISAGFTCRLTGGHRTFVSGGFYYGTSPSLSDAVDVPSIVVDGTMTGIVSGLEMDKVYYVKAYVTDDEGTLESEVKSFDSAVFNLSGADYHLPYTGGEFTLDVSSNIDYYFNFGHTDWITTIATKTATVGYTFTVQPNESLYARTATIVATSLDEHQHQEITVVQDEAPITFSDEGFKQYLLSRLDADKSGEIEIDEVSGVTEMDICTDNVESISDLEYFPALTSITLKGSAAGKGSLKSVDLTPCKELKSIVISHNPLSSIDLSLNPNVTYLDVSGNSLTGLDLTSMPLLETLVCSDNALTELSLGQNHSLKTVDCSRNSLKAINGIVSTALTSLVCDDNALESLSLSNSRGLQSLSCERNALTDLVLSSNVALETLHCSSNALDELYLRRNVAVKEVVCDSNPITYFAFGNPAALRKLSCRDTQVSNLDLDDFTGLQYLDITGTMIKVLDVSTCPDLKYLYCCSDYLSILYIISSQRIDGITPSRSTDHVSDNTSIFSRDVEAVIKDSVFKAYLIKYFDNDKNGMLTIDECEQIEYVQVSTDEIKTLEGIEYFSNLRSLQCTGSVDSDGSPLGLLTSIDISRNAYLEHFVCSSNHLTKLDLSHNPRLKTLWCYNNRLTSLDFSHNTALVDLNCERNFITSLDLSMCPSLETLDCSPMAGASGANVLQSVKLGRVRIPYVNDLTLRRNASNIPSSTKLVFEGIPGPTFLFNINAHNYDASTGTFAKEEFALLSQDIQLAKKAELSDDHVTIAKGACGNVSYSKSIDNPFNRYNLGSNTLTVIFKVAPSQSGKSPVISCADADNVNFDISSTDSVFGLYNEDSDALGSVQTYSQPNIVVLRATSAGLTTLSSYTDNVYSSTFDTSWGGVAKNISIFCNKYNNSYWAGDFYWMYVSLEELTDDEIDSVVEYNENMK